MPRNFAGNIRRIMGKKKPPDDWEDMPEFKKYCTCNEYDWPETYCPYSEEINEELVHCNCCPFCHQQCLDDI